MPASVTVRARHDDQDTKARVNPGSGTGWTRVIGAGLRIGLAIVIPLSLLGALANNIPRANHQAPRTAVERAPQIRPSRPLATSPTVSRPTPPAPASTIASAPEAQPPRSQPEPSIRWADSPPNLVAWQRCNQARTAVLIDNSASNRQQRDHLCAAVQGSDTPDELKAGSGRSSVVVVEPWKTLHSAGEPTPN
ncbi:hypothetical protein CKO42_23480 [Lamprobacter modestohalophilus]|uniref:Uncharacterized protein n=1 Tax=Lamprobacter modestohalophilus TaxID=1064514 RepID=A0A9X0WD60_9GAMM|nr:hypothetical protein [Lamprobacter modestohalophilus]MBK1621323.1 hypothetical protein [Lamprobacter modestohalophilus]